MELKMELGQFPQLQIETKDSSRVEKVKGKCRESGGGGRFGIKSALRDIFSKFSNISSSNNVIWKVTQEPPLVNCNLSWMETHSGKILYFQRILQFI